MDNLEQVTVDDAVKDFKGEVMDAKCVRVIDGDTIEVVMILDKPRLFRCRLYGCDCPEIRRAKSSDEKRRGLEAKQYMVDLIEDKIVKICFTGARSFERLVGSVYYNDQDLSNELIKGGYAVKYTKKK